MDFKAQLDDLEKHVQELKASVNAATSETHEQLQQRIDQAQADTDQALSEAKQQGYQVDGRTLEETIWQTKMSMVSRFSKPREPGIQLNTTAIYLGVMSHNLPILSREEMHRLAGFWYGSRRPMGPGRCGLPAARA